MQSGFHTSYPVLYRQLMIVGLLGAAYRLQSEALLVQAAVELTLPSPDPLRRYRALAARVAIHLARSKAVAGSSPSRQTRDFAARQLVIALNVGLHCCAIPPERELRPSGGYLLH